MYLPQAISLPPSLGIKWDLFLLNRPAEEVELEPTVVTYRVAMPLVPAVSLRSRQVHRGNSGPFLDLEATDRLHLRWELGL
jgi:hypothetical protein